MASDIQAVMPYLRGCTHANEVSLNYSIPSSNDDITVDQTYFSIFFFPVMLKTILLQNMLSVFLTKMLMQIGYISHYDTKCERCQGMKCYMRKNCHKFRIFSFLDLIFFFSSPQTVNVLKQKLLFLSFPCFICLKDILRISAQQTG